MVVDVVEQLPWLRGALPIELRAGSCSSSGDAAVLVLRSIADESWPNIMRLFTSVNYECS